MIARRTALQSLLAVICGAFDPEQKTTPTGPLTSLGHLNQPQSLSVYLNWKTVTVYRGSESVTLDQDELFDALTNNTKAAQQPQGEV